MPTPPRILDTTRALRVEHLGGLGSEVETRTSLDLACVLSVSEAVSADTLGIDPGRCLVEMDTGEAWLIGTPYEEARRAWGEWRAHYDAPAHLYSRS